MSQVGEAALCSAGPEVDISLLLLHVTRVPADTPPPNLRNSAQLQGHIVWACH